MCVVYDLTQENSLDRVGHCLFVDPMLTYTCTIQVTSFWLPLIKQCSVGLTKPVILAGNKVTVEDFCHLVNLCLSN